MSSIPARPGQVWQSSDSRHRGRRVSVVAVYGAVAVLENVETKRRTTITTDRLRGRFHWRLVSWPDLNESGEDATPNTEVR